MSCCDDENDASLPPTEYPVSGGIGACVATVYDQQHFLDLFDRILSFEYLQPIKATPLGGYEMYQMAAKVGERLSQAIHAFECGAYIVFAPEGSYAEGTVQFYRATYDAGEVTVLVGSIVGTCFGQRYVTLESAEFGATDLGPVEVPVRAVAMGYAWNAQGEVELPNSVTLPGDVCDPTTLYLDPPFGDPTIQVRNVDPIAGGESPMLSGLGEDRGMPRGAFETAQQYRHRLRVLPDTVSPAAIRRAAASVLDAASIPWRFEEAGMNVTTTAFVWNPDVWREGRMATEQITIDWSTQRGVFAIVVGLNGTQDLGDAAFYDETDMGDADQNAYDWEMAYDGFPRVWTSALQSLWRMVEAKRAAGVRWYILVDPVTYG